MEKLTKNYHTHTTFCGHAIDEDNENYVIEAINNGFTDLGFSDHAPFKNINHPRMRMNFERFEEYIALINKFKEKYKDKIKICIGLEIEYYKKKHDYYVSLFKDYKLDYLILGQHCYYDELGNCRYYFEYAHDIKGMKMYASDLIDGINSGLFSYVCHPDLYLQNALKWDSDTKKIAIDIIEASNIAKMPLEININGFINREIYHHGCKYPDVNFFSLAKQMGSKFIFGIDAHDSKRLNQNKIPYEKLDEFLKACLIEDKDIIKELNIK